MCHRFSRWCLVLLVGALGWGLQPIRVHAQAGATLPAGWQQMSPDDFASAIRVLQENDTFKLLSSDVEQAAKAQGKKFFLQVDFSNTTLSYPTIEMLHWVTRYELVPVEIERTRTALLARQDNWAGQTYEVGRAKIKMMMRLKFDEGTIISEARRWVQAGGTVAQVPATDLTFDIVRQMFSDVQLANGSFSVQWNGLVNPPQTGAYQFLISPVNVNAGYSPQPVKFVMTVSVGGQVVLNSSPAKPADPSSSMDPSNWVTQSNVVTLTAGQPVPLQITVSVDSPQTLPSATLHALLFWKTPDRLQSIVPQANLTLPDGSGTGLKATYTWTANGQPQTLTRTDPNIDFAWTNQTILLSKDQTAANQSADVLWQALTSASFITAAVGPPVKLHRFLEHPDDASAALTTARRSTFLDLLLQNPALLDAMDTKQVVRFFQPFRVGVPDKALDVFGAWAGRQADMACALSQDLEFDPDTRAAAAAMATLTTQQLPNHAVRLQNEYLQLADGRCSLPVAYTLAASYLEQKKFGDWTTFLDTKLSDPTLVGDSRVNWLIARAQAEEIRFLPQGPNVDWNVHNRPRALDGKTFLDQALKAAQSPPVKARVAREIACRLVWGQQLQAAQDLLLQTAGSLPADQQAVLTALKTQIGTMATAQTQASQSQATASQQAYLATLKQRRDQAAANGDAAAVKRYGALLSAAGNQ